MKTKNLGTWIVMALGGLLLTFILNTTPLAHAGLAIELPFAWRDSPVSGYRDTSCSRRLEGIPFAFKRPNEMQTCTFDINNFALLLNGFIGAGVTLSCVLISEKRWHKR